uniref:Uncharacterized protein n=1 Tax=Anguilla anguilla TaxID=7936 RepID=A0A0E9RJH7_ANGAN
MGSLCLVMFLCLNVGKSYGIVVTCDVFGSQTHPLKTFFFCSNKAQLYSVLI